MEFTGKITHITEEVLIGAKSLPKVSIILEEEGEMEDYKRNSMVVDAIADKVTAVNKYKVGDTVTVSLNFKSSEYNGKYYNRVTLWKIVGETKEDEDAAF